MVFDPHGCECAISFAITGRAPSNPPFGASAATRPPKKSLGGS